MDWLETAEKEIARGRDPAQLSHPDDLESWREIMRIRYLELLEMAVRDVKQLRVFLGCARGTADDLRAEIRVLEEARGMSFSEWVKGNKNPSLKSLYKGMLRLRDVIRGTDGEIKTAGDIDLVDIGDMADQLYAAVKHYEVMNLDEVDRRLT